MKIIRKIILIDGKTGKTADHIALDCLKDEEKKCWLEEVLTRGVERLGYERIR